MGKFHRKELVLSGLFHEQFGYEVKRAGGSEDWLLFFTLSGTGSLHSGHHAVQVERHDFAAFAPGQAQHYHVAPTAAHWEFYWCHCQLRPTIERLLASEAIFHQQACPASIRTAFAEMHTAACQRNHRQSLLAMNAIERAILLLPTADPEQGMDSRIAGVIQHIRQHLDSPMRVADLATLAGCSASRFAHLFKKETGYSVAAYIERERMAQAASLLIRTTWPLHHIADACGFTDPFYFSHRFKKYHDQSPSHWRQGANEPAPDSLP